MFQDALRIVRRLTFFLGVLLTLLVGLELARGFAFFHRLGPAWAWTYAAVLVALFLGLVVYIARVWLAHPKALTPPHLPPPGEADHRQMRAYCKYLVKYLERLEQNKNLQPEYQQEARDQVAAIRDLLGAHPLNDDLVLMIEQTESHVITPLLSHLAEKAGKEVRSSVRDVMLGVTLSPYHSIDVLIVLYRNSAMILRTVRVYSSRPTSREQFLVLRDVFRVVVTLNFLYVGRNLLENLFSHIPFLGRVVDDIGQGLGAGLFTSAAGHAAMQRCAAYRGWNKAEATDSLASQTKIFLADVRDIFARDVLPDLRNRIQAETDPEEVEKAGFWDSVAQGINASIDATAGVVDTLVVKPTVSSTRQVVKAGAAVGRGVAKAGSSVAQAVVPATRKKEE